MRNNNPSAWPYRVVVALLALIATGIATYMGLYQWHIIDHVWDPLFGHGTEKVLISDVSHQITRWIRLPDAIFGALAYLGDIIFALAGSSRRWYDRPWLVILFGLDVIPVGCVAVILVVLQGVAVGYWCFLCLITALFSLSMVFFAYSEVLASLIYLKEIWKKTKDTKAVWKAFWGTPVKHSLNAAEQTMEKMYVAKDL